MKRHLRNVLSEVNVKKDIAPHLMERAGGPDLIWVGPYDRVNEAPIADTGYGTRFAPIQIIGALYEIGIRPHLSAVEVLSTFLTKSGNLQKFGSSRRMIPTNVSPWLRRFGTLGVGYYVEHSLPSRLVPLTRKNRERLLLMGKAAVRLQREMDPAQWCGF